MVIKSSSPPVPADRSLSERRRLRRRRRARLAAVRLGRSRGGLTTKIHLAFDTACRPLAIIVIAGQAGDRPQFVPVLRKIKVGGPVVRPRTRYDRDSANYQAGLELRAAILWIRSLATQ